jgi:hypothetical protein
MPALPFRRIPIVGLLVAALFVLLFALPGSLAAQSIVTVAPQQCVWRTGDDLAWSAPNLDESGWQPYSTWKVNPAEPRIWIRCHADLGPARGSANPAVQVGAFAAYDLYLNGERIGGAGNLGDGSFNLAYLGAYPVASGQLSSSLSTLALRVAPRGIISDSGPFRNLLAAPLEIRAGDSEILDALRARTVLQRSLPYARTALCFSAIGVVAMMLLGLWFYDRSRRELALLSASCLSLAVLRVNEFCTAALWNVPVSVSLLIVVAGNVAFTCTQLPFLYALARRRVPLGYRILLAFTVLGYVPSAIGALFPNHLPLWFGPINVNINRPIVIVLHMAVSVAPFLAFRPYSAISRRMRPLAALCMLWGLADLAWFVVQSTNTPILPIPGLFVDLSVQLLEVRAFITAVVLAALLGLLFREQRQATEEHALFAGEIQAARNVQQYLIPKHLPPTPGFSIESEYRPSREVGGDFFQVLPQAADGSLLIVVGDVAGKGVEAGMLATLIVGAVRTAASFTSDPARILALLNERLCGRGFVTCLALRVEADGNATLVNAGHLPPYLNGKEMAVEGALPLGVIAGMQFPAFHFRFADGDSMMLMTDGVAEAQDAQGRLFGFARISELLGGGAGGAALAVAAQDFGQQDDITILTIVRAAPSDQASLVAAPSTLASA